MMIRITNLLHRPLRAGLVAALMLGMVPPLQAAEPPTVRVYVGDLELASAHGQRELQRRVDAAIAQVCTPPGSAVVQRPRSRRLVRECRAQAWAGVEKQLARHGVPSLVASSRP